MNGPETLPVLHNCECVHVAAALGAWRARLEETGRRGSLALVPPGCLWLPAGEGPHGHLARKPSSALWSMPFPPETRSRWCLLFPSACQHTHGRKRLGSGSVWEEGALKPEQPGPATGHPLAVGSPVARPPGWSPPAQQDGVPPPVACAGRRATMWTPPGAEDAPLASAIVTVVINDANDRGGSSGHAGPELTAHVPLLHLLQGCTVSLSEVTAVRRGRHPVEARGERAVVLFSQETSGGPMSL